jgi:hypothetical protein
VEERRFPVAGVGRDPEPPRLCGPSARLWLASAPGARQPSGHARFSYSGLPCSTQRSNNSTRSGGHAPSHGMEPFFKRSAMAAAWVWTSA